MGEHKELTSIVIPVWNGASVIVECLTALYTNTQNEALEVICVDNASTDESAALIASTFPPVHLLKHDTNLGFAGGINAGVAMAQGDLFVLLNQDCQVRPGWLEHLRSALQQNPDWGIAGCTLFDAEGNIEHAGAYLAYPSVRGVHLSDVDSQPLRTVEYVTGALFAIRPSLWTQLGVFDPEFFPAYYEETDYCYRARHAGFQVGYVAAAQAQHLRSSQEWRRDPLKHTINQERSRYRFIAKHLTSAQIEAFGVDEHNVLSHEEYFDQAMARLLAARHSLRNLAATLSRRELDLHTPADLERARLLQATFRSIMHHAQFVALRLSLADLLTQPDWAEKAESVDASIELLSALEPEIAINDSPIDVTTLPAIAMPVGWAETLAAYLEIKRSDDAAALRLSELRKREHTLINQLLPVPRPQGRWARWKWLMNQLTRLAENTDAELEIELHRVHSKILDELEQRNVKQDAEIALLSNLLNMLIPLLDQKENTDLLWRKEISDWVSRTLLSAQASTLQTLQNQDRILKQLHRRIQMIELLTDYDYR